MEEKRGEEKKRKKEEERENDGGESAESKNSPSLRRTEELKSVKMAEVGYCW